MTKKGYAAAGIAVVGFVAVSAFYLLGSASSQGSNFLALTQSGAGVDLEFVNFIGKYQKQYATKEEFEYRMQVFLANLAQAENHNSQNSGSSYRLGVNKFSDLTFEEFQAARLGLKGKAQGHRKIDRSGENSFIVFNTTNLPSSVDWRSTGAVTSVKDQGTCGSCYAFSAVGAIEGQYWNLTRKSTDLSVQQIIDCADGEYQNQGCGGGLPDWVFDYVWDNGIETAADYPLTGNGGYCNDDPREYAAQLTKYWDVTHLNPDQLKGAVAQVGPISIGVGAGNAAWFQYKSGIIDNADICLANLDHAVLLVGYGTEAGRDFWIVKNSWGSDWGENGYVRILVTPGYGVCGVNMTPIFPSIKLI